jgi:hypothetical protein
MNLFDPDPYRNPVLQFGSETCQGYQQNRAPKARPYRSPGHRPGFIDKMRDLRAEGPAYRLHFPFMRLPCCGSGFWGGATMDA